MPQGSLKSSQGLQKKIKAYTLFRNVDDALLREVFREFELVHLPEGEALIHQGDVSEALYLVLEGQLEVVTRQDDGTLTPLGEVGPGEPLGEIQILAGGMHTASVFARRKSDVIKIPGKILDILIERSPEFLSCLAHTSKRRLLRSQMAAVLTNLFGILDKETLQHIEGHVEWQSVRSEEILFHEGDPGDALYIVLYGRLRVLSGRGSRLEKDLGEIGRGECVGEMSLFTDERRSATVFAIRDSELVKMTRASFEVISNEHPQFMRAITRMLIGRLKQNTGRTCAVRTVKNIALIPLKNVDAGEIARRIISPLACYGPVLGLNRRRVDELLHRKGIVDSPDDSAGNIRLLTWLNEQETKHAFILFEADPDPTPWTRRCLRQADHVLLVAHAGERPDVMPVDPLLLPSTGGNTSARRSLVLLHHDGRTLPNGTGRWLDRWPVDEHHHVRLERDADFSRLARFIAGRTVSLVLSGGGARGLAYIGVMRALNEAGIPVDIVGGASMGAVAASYIAMDYDVEAMYHKAVETFLQRNPFSDFTLPFISLVRCRKLDAMVRRAYEDIAIEDLWINFFCVSSNLSTAELVIHRKGLLGKSIRASVSLPGITQPVIEGNHLLVDGGVLNNLPMDIMQGLFSGRMIAADVTGDVDLTISIKEIPSPWKLFFDKLRPNTQPVRVPTIFDVLTRTIVLGSVQKRNQVMQEADLYLRLPVHAYGMMEFKAIDDLIEIGYKHTKEKLKDWRY